jgi:hypothetical protein
MDDVLLVDIVSLLFAYKVLLGGQRRTILAPAMLELLYYKCWNFWLVFLVWSAVGCGSLLFC